MKKLILDLDDMYIEYPTSIYDIGGSGHSIIIEDINLGKTIEEMVEQYRKDLREAFVEYDEDE